MTAVNFNPFTWDSSSKAIQSSVTSLELKSGNSGQVNVSNLDEDIVIVIPILRQPVNNTNASKALEHSFLKPSKLTFRSYYAEVADVPVNIKISVDETGVVLELFVKFGSRPSIEDFDQNATITFNSTCGNQTYGELNETSCVLETDMKVIPSKPGLLYVGLLYLGAKNSEEHSRERRSCFGHGRQRRSCVGFKDPPPKGVTKTVVPQYDPSTDVNYTITITQSSCLYWSEDKNKWTSDGCKVIFMTHENSQQRVRLNVSWVGLLMLDIQIIYSNLNSGYIIEPKFSSTNTTSVFFSYEVAIRGVYK